MQNLSMEFSNLIEQANEIKRRYAELNHINRHRQWGVTEYTQGLVGDVGDLVKLIMARNQYRSTDDVDRKIAHELVDCLWSVLVIADELDIDLEAEFSKEMRKLEQRIADARDQKPLSDP